MSSLFNRWRFSAVSIDKGFGPCFRKGAYRTKEIAEAYAKKSEERDPKLKLYIYPCKVCKKFHLTRQKQAEKSA